MISRMAKVRKFGLTEPVTKESTSKAKSMERASFSGLMVLSMKANSSSTISKELASTSGLTVESMRVNGRIIKWTGKEY